MDGSRVMTCHNCNSRSAEAYTSVERKDDPKLREPVYECERFDELMRASDTCACFCPRPGGPYELESR